MHHETYQLSYERTWKTLKEWKKICYRKFDETIDWVHSQIVVRKPISDKLGVCLDPRSLNVAIKKGNCANYQQLKT